MTALRDITDKESQATPAAPSAKSDWTRSARTPEPTYVDADWLLFVDWCSVIGRRSLPATERDIQDFLAAVPGAQLRRLRAIRRAHEQARLTPPAPAARTAPLLRHGEEWARIPHALAQLPTLRYPEGLRGRRDGWLMILVGELGLTRQEALTYREVPAVERCEPAASCPACVVSRWLRVVGPAYLGDRHVVRDLLDPRGADLAAHDCEVPLDDGWRQAPTLLPAIDQHGWVNMYRPISLTAVSTIAKQRQVPAGDPPGPVPVTEPIGRFRDALDAELMAAFNEVDATLAAMIAQTEAALREP